MKNKQEKLKPLLTNVLLSLYREMAYNYTHQLQNSDY